MESARTKATTTPPAIVAIDTFTFKAINATKAIEPQSEEVAIVSRCSRTGSN